MHVCYKLTESDGRAAAGADAHVLHDVISCKTLNAWVMLGWLNVHG
jgi:hypothetical protein